MVYPADYVTVSNFRRRAVFNAEKYVSDSSVEIGTEVIAIATQSVALGCKAENVKYCDVLIGSDAEEQRPTLTSTHDKTRN